MDGRVVQQQRRCPRLTYQALKGQSNADKTFGCADFIELTSPKQGKLLAIFDHHLSHVFQISFVAQQNHGQLTRLTVASLLASGNGQQLLVRLKEKLLATTVFSFVRSHRLMNGS